MTQEKTNPTPVPQTVDDEPATEMLDLATLRERAAAFKKAEAERQAEPKSEG